MDGSSTKAVELKPHSDVAEEDPARRGGPGTDEADANEKAPRRSRRVASLDVFRGLTVADIEAMKEFGMSALLQAAAELLNDRLPEAREAARGVVASMHAAFAKDAAASGQEDDAAASWESLCSLSLPPISAQAVAKIAAAASSSPSQ